jgi:hypothetical protein
MLRWLLRVRTTKESAMDSAPWLTECEFEVLRKAASKMDWSQFGEEVKLTDAERTEHKLWYWPPIDVPWEQVRDRQSRLNKENDRKRSSDKRAKNKALREALNNSDDREDAIIQILMGADAPPRGIILPPICPTSDGWFLVSVLVNRTEIIRAFRLPKNECGPPMGFQVKRDSLRALVHRTLKRMRDDGLVEIKKVKSARGGNVCLVRISRQIGQRKTEKRARNRVTPAAKAKTFDQSTASTAKPASEQRVGRAKRAIGRTATRPQHAVCPDARAARGQYTARRQAPRSRREAAAEESSDERSLTLAPALHRHRAR